MTPKAELVDTALKVLVDYDKANELLWKGTDAMREVYGGEYETVLMPYDLSNSMFEMLDLILCGLASYWLWECGRKGKVIEADGKEWPITSIEDIRAYVMREE